MTDETFKLARSVMSSLIDSGTEFTIDDFDAKMIAKGVPERALRCLGSNIITFFCKKKLVKRAGTKAVERKRTVHITVWKKS